MSEVNFSYKSIENMVRLLVTCRLDQLKDVYPNYSGIFYAVFDSEQGEQRLLKILEELYPDGKTITPEDVDIILARCIKYIDDEEDECVRKYRNEEAYMTGSWVYSKWNDRAYACDFGKHTQMIAELLCDFYGKSLLDLSDETISKFIKSNFVIKSDNSDLDKIANVKNITSLVVHSRFKLLKGAEITKWRYQSM